MKHSARIERLARRLPPSDLKIHYVEAADGVIVPGQPPAPPGTDWTIIYDQIGPPSCKITDEKNRSHT